MVMQMRTICKCVCTVADQEAVAFIQAYDHKHIPGWGEVGGLYEAGRDVRLMLGYKL